MVFQIDTSAKMTKIQKHWNFCIGSCHAATALREDCRRDLKKCRDAFGVRYLRFHGIFNDDMSVLRKSLLGEYVLSFSNIDNIFDFLLSIGMKPFVELSFMPSCLKSGEMTIFHYKANVTLPNDWERWAWLVDSFVRHLIERYGRDEVRTWYFEVWNEPNLGKESGINGARFFSGDKDDYFKLYLLTAKTVKAVDSRLKVGGPATSNNAWITDTVEFCKKSGAPLDFVSTHHYPTDVVLGYGVEDSANFTTAFNSLDADDKDGIKKMIADYLTFQSDIWARVERGVLTDMAKRARSEAGDLPLFYTEWSSLAGLESDGSFGASFIVKTALDNVGIVDGSAYWSFSDIFEEKGFPNCAFHGGYGLLTIDGIAKAPFHAFALLDKLSDCRGKTFRKGNVDIYTFYDERASAYQILAVNHNSLLHEIEDEKVRIDIKGCDVLESADIWRIDDNHANPLEAWKRMGAPAILSEAQIHELNGKSVLERESIAVKDGGVEFALPKMGIALIVVYKR